MLERCVIPRYFTALPRERAHVHARADDRPIINHGPRCPCKDTREDGCKASCKHVPIVASFPCLCTGPQSLVAAADATRNKGACVCAVLILIFVP